MGRMFITFSRPLEKNDMSLETDVVFEQKLGLGSTDLRDVFGRDGIPKANDTSFGCGYAPLSTIEQLTLEAEKYMNGPMGIKGSGTDIKVMGVRNNGELTLTICNGMVSKHISGIQEYKELIAQMTEKVGSHLKKITDKDVTIEINTGDNYENEKVFLTVTGTSAEHGDDGSVGRGNRANGLIAPYRPTSLEATSGKNPVNHTGKIYNVLSQRIAEEIAAETGSQQVYVRILSQIGKPIDHPLVCSVQLIGDESIRSDAQRIADERLANISQVTDWVLNREVTTF